MTRRLGSILKHAWPRPLAALLGGVLVASAVTKLTLPATDSSMFGQLARGLPVIATVLVAVEAILGIWLISGRKPAAAALACLFLLSLFSGAILYDMFSHHPLPCGCFGSAWKQAHEPAVIEHGLLLGLVRNLLLAALAMLVYYRTARPCNAGIGPERPTEQGGARSV